MGKAGIPKATREKMKEDKKKAKEKKVPKKEDKKVKEKQIVRFKGTGLDGTKRLDVSLTGVKGVSYNLSRAIISSAKLDPATKLGELKENELKKMEDVLNDLPKNVPAWMLNRQKDYESGKSKHLTEVDLLMGIRDDIRRLRKIRAYRGIRHELGLPVRGQRTKSSGRKGAKVGVSKRKIQQEKKK